MSEKMDRAAQKLSEAVSMINGSFIMEVAGALLGLAILYSVWKQHQSRNDFNIFDLLMYKGKLAHAYVFSTFGFLTHTWAVLYWTVTDKAKTEDFLAYAGIWITPVLARILTGRAESVGGNGHCENGNGKENGNGNEKH